MESELRLPRVLEKGYTGHENREIEIYTKDEIRSIEAIHRLNMRSVLILVPVTLFSLAFIAALIRSFFFTADINTILALLGSGGGLSINLRIVYKYYFSKRDDEADKEGDEE